MGNRLCLLSKSAPADCAVVGKWDGDASWWSSSFRGITGFSGMGRFSAEQCIAPIFRLVPLSHSIRFSDSVLVLCLVANKDYDRESLDVRVREPRRGRL